ncbi:MAG: sensor histidine kinase [Bacteroidota bacterium]
MISLQNIVQDRFYRSIPDDQLIKKQRYNLFRATSIVGAVSCFIFILQSLTVYSLAHPVVYLTLAMGIIFIANMLMLPFHKRAKIAYLILSITATFIIHLNMYPAGGIKASAALYFAPIILMIFMLLGNRFGQLFFAIVVINAAYFYFISENTTITSYDLIGDSSHQINIDFLVTSIFAFLILGVQMSYLESGKNEVIERITLQTEELKLKNKELNKLSIVASKADNSIIITDEKGNISWVNDGFTRLSGFNFESAVGQNVLTFFTGKNTDSATLKEVNLSINESLPFSGELLRYKNNGKSFWSQITMTPIEESENNAKQFIFIESDITPRKIAEEKMIQYNVSLEKSIKELDKFAYVVSHDLKAPLRAIGNLTGWIEEDMGDNLPDSIKPHFDVIKGRVVRMEGLIDGILEYTKLTKKEGELSIVDTNSLIKESFDLLGASENVMLHLNDHFPVLKTEKIKLEQVFMNLLNNAVKYNDKEDKQVWVGFKDLGDSFEFFVKDNGPGIENRYHDKIFVIFQTLNARDQVEARGIGLAIVKNIIDEAGGEIWIESEKGCGATFKFTWPKQKRRVEQKLMIDDYDQS